MSVTLHQVAPPTRGDIVHVRSRCHVVEATRSAPYGTTVDLACLEDAAQGELSSVLWEAELAPQIITEQAWDSIGSKGFDSREYFSSFFNTLRWHCVTATDPSLFQSPFRAGINLDPYQLEPLRKALRLPRVNLFIADDVGLGKTIEAGLIASELLLRKRIKNVVVSCPPSMLYQWKEELDNRFGIVFEILDREYIERVRQEQGFTVNPWTTYPYFLVSHRLLIDDTYAEPLKQWLENNESQSLFILDEAHHAAPASASKYAVDSRFTQTIRSLSQRFEHRLFLSATPHNGHSNSFSALLEILDPQRFTRGVQVVKSNLDDIMVRRLKNDIRLLVGGFPERVVEQVDIDGLPADAPELVLIEMMDRYQTLRSEQVKGEKKHIQNRSLIVFSHLQQRLLSSPEAFARTISKHAETAEKKFNPKAKLQLITKGVDADSEEATLDEDAQEAILAKELAKADPIAELNAEASIILQEMVTIANEARYQPDAKTKKLIEWIAKNQCPAIADSSSQEGAKWNDTRVIIFTEWDASLTYLNNMLTRAIAGTDQAEARIETYRGSTGPDRREAIKAAFNANPAENPVRILLATDAAREGLNLQAHCHHLFHYDVPWNPGRLEQRNGRIDRKLQEQPQVFCHYFFYKQRPQDRVIDALIRKTATIEDELGSLSQVLEKRLTSKLEFGITKDQVDELAASIEADSLPDHQQVTRDELEIVRERQDALKAQVQLLDNRITQARRWINYSHDSFEQALSCSLKLAKYSSISPLSTDGKSDANGELYHFPNLETGQGLDPTWTATLDTLRQAPKNGKRDHRWRSESPIRPIRFTPPKTMDDSSVQLHLGHRIAKRLLSRFLSQGFVQHDISRACLGQSDDAIPRVVLLGRLGLFGKGATRLHEEIITITARWEPLEKRNGNPLKAYAREAEARTMEILENSLLSEQSSIPEDTQSQLLASIETDVASLRPLLDARAKEAEQSARLKLVERAEIEAKAIEEVLTAQKKRVEATLKRSTDDDQMTFGFNVEEKRQLDRDRRYWKKWLTTVDQDLINEPKRIHQFYEIETPRIEPIGLVYLWPAK